MSSPEQMIQMVRWRLGLPYNGDPVALEREWAALGPRQEKLADDVAVEVAQLLRLLMRAKIAGKPTPDHLAWALPMADLFAACVKMSEATASPQVNEKLRKVVQHYLNLAPQQGVGSRIRVGPALPPSPPAVPPPPPAPQTTQEPAPASERPPLRGWLKDVEGAAPP